MATSVKFTAEQQEAIDSRNKEILVSAAAGSGKTAVLVERIINMIVVDQTPIEQLVVLTFTNAAATQMKNRIRTRLQTLLLTVAETEKHFIEQQLLRLPLSTICTFHAYCIQILRQYYQYIELAPVFKIAEENLLALLKEEALHQTFETIFANQAEYGNVIEYFVTGTKLNRLETIILELYERTRSYADIDKWMEYAGSYVTNQAMIEQLIAAYETLQYDYLATWIAEVDYLISTLMHYPKNQQMLAELHQQLQIIEKMDFSALKTSLAVLEFPKWPPIKKDDVTAESKQAHQTYNKLKKEIEKVRKNFYQTSDIIQQQQHCAPIVINLLAIVKLFETNYQQLKAQRDFVDFSDLEHYMITLLRQHQEVRENISQNIVEILVDEYQDTNEVQDTILRLLKNEHNRIFMVGDIKQSIYRFRLADPTIFLNKKSHYQTNENSEQQLILLNKNFRSSNNVLDTANVIFEQLFQLDIQYDESERLYLGNTALASDEYYTKWHLFDTVVAEDADDAMIIQTQAEKKATVIVNEIIRLVNNEQIYDEKIAAYRPIKLADIAILFRSRGSTLISYIETRLEEANIHYSSETDKGYFDATEVNVILSLLDILENPYNTISLLGYLRSPICAFTDEDLYLIADFYKQSDEPKTTKFYDYIAYYLLHHEKNTLTEQLETVQAELTFFRTKLAMLPLSNVLETIYERTHYFSFVAALPNGKVRLANLKILIQLAKNQEQLGRNSLYAFNNYMRKLQKNNRDFAIAKPENDLADSINMMTIHKSKGLEFPIVFLVDLDKTFNEQDMRASYQMSKTYGLALQYHDVSRHIRYKTWHYEYIANQVAFETKAEELRVLYVALTRPMQHLHLFLDRREASKSVDTAKNILGLRNYADALYRIYEMNAHNMSSWQEAVVDINHPIYLDKLVETTSELVVEKQETRLTETELTKIIAQMEEKYPYQTLQNYPQKQTVTELKKRLDLQQDIEQQLPSEQIIPTTSTIIAQTLYQEKPQFMQEATKMTPMEKGTLYHLLLQYYDWEKLPDVVVYLDTLVAQAVINQAMLAEVDIAKIRATIADITNTYLMNGYQVVAKELPFSFAHLAKDIYHDALFTTEKVLIQGKIDLLLAKEEQYLIIDFKTDKLSANQTVATLEQRYEKQLALYREAVMKFYQTTKVETKLYAIFS